MKNRILAAEKVVVSDSRSPFLLENSHFRFDETQFHAKNHWIPLHKTHFFLSTRCCVSPNGCWKSENPEFGLGKDDNFFLFLPRRNWWFSFFEHPLDETQNRSESKMWVWCKEFNGFLHEIEFHRSESGCFLAKTVTDYPIYPLLQLPECDFWWKLQKNMCFIAQNGPL